MENPKYTALQISKYFIKKAIEENDNKLTNLKLQKILYYAQGWYLANFGKKLFSDRIEAWKYGPAIRSVYRAYKGFGNQPIKESVSEEDVKVVDDATKKFLDVIWDTYKNNSGTDLIFSTHNEKPWNEAWRNSKEDDTEISAGSMESYFKRLING